MSTLSECDFKLIDVVTELGTMVSNDCHDCPVECHGCSNDFANCRASITKGHYDRLSGTNSPSSEASDIKKNPACKVDTSLKCIACF